MGESRKNKALFLDRDGTINVEKNYVFRKEDFQFRKGIFDLIKNYQEKGFLIFIVSNQSGIARGFYTEKDYNTLTLWMLKEFKNRGITVTKVYHCPHHPKFTGPCNCRKPNPGMLLRAINEFDIDPEKSVLIGDKKSDIDTGKNAGVGTNLDIQNLLEDNEF